MDRFPHHAVHKCQGIYRQTPSWSLKTVPVWKDSSDFLLLLRSNSGSGWELWNEQGGALRRAGWEHGFLWGSGSNMETGQFPGPQLCFLHPSCYYLESCGDYAHVSLRMYVCVCISVHTYIYVQTHIHIYMYIYRFIDLFTFKYSPICYKYFQTHRNAEKLMQETPTCLQSRANNCSHFAIIAVSLCMFLHTHSFCI